MSFNGWKNYETWNVWLWITNDRPLYDAMMEYIAEYGKRASYHGFHTYLHYAENDETPDRVEWWDTSIDTESLDEAIQEMVQEHTESN